MKYLPIIFLLCFLLIGCEATPPEQKVGIAQPGPSFSLNDKDGKAWSLEGLKGKVVFVHFWATWCPPCREEMPLVQKLSSTITSENFQILAIAHRDDPAIVNMVTKEAGWTFPVLHDLQSEVSTLYDLTGVPETFIIDKNGMLRERFIGPVEWDSPVIQQRIQSYIDE